MKLNLLLAAADLSDVQVEPLGSAEKLEITSVQGDSRRVTAGALFVASDGLRTQGVDYIPAAIAAGASAVVVSAATDLSSIADLDKVVVVRAPSARLTLGPLASASHGHPSHTLRVVALTGTNGKTTTATLVAQLLCNAGERAAALGTLGLWTAEGVEPGGLTTPDAVDLQARLASLRDRGFTTVVLEASSHALDQGRLLGTRIAVAGWTNLSRDHLDYHGDFATYAAAKMRLFTELLPVGHRAWVNADDAAVAVARDVHGVCGYSFGAVSDAEVQVAGLHLDARGLAVRVHVHGHTPLALQAPLLGRHNAHNLVLAALICRELGLSNTALSSAAEVLRAPPGRLEPVPNTLGALILVDYAHTPDALTEVLAVGRELLAPEGRLHVVFGCGGDRDAGKRQPMGLAAGTSADVSLATSDNPRHEDPHAILRPVAAGLTEGGARQVDRLVPSTIAQFVDDRIFCVEPDRAAAIRRAIGLLSPGDVLIIAGKGHETTQTIGDEARPFDDVAVTKRWLRQRKSAPASAIQAVALRDFSFDADAAAAATNGTLIHADSGARTIRLTTDSRDVPTDGLFVPLVGDRFDGHAYLASALAQGAGGALCAPGRAPEAIEAARPAWVCEVPDTLVGLGDLARAHRRRFHGPVVCITGSNGKTSTKELTALTLGAAGEVLATYKNHNNRIGVPQTLARLREAHRFAVVECGMSIPGEIAELGRIAEPDIAVLTNVSAAHLEGLGSIEGVAQEKTDLLRALGRGQRGGPGVAIVPADEPLIEPHLVGLTAKVIRVGTHPNADVRVVGDVDVVGLTQRFEADVCGTRVNVNLPAIGLHMVRNALTALAVAHALDVNLRAAAWALEQFEPVGRRMRPLQLGERLILEDCYNANPASMRVALDTLSSLPGPHLAVVGDMLELGPRAAELHAKLGAAVVAAGVEQVIARGSFAEDVVRGARESGLAAASAFETDAQGADLVSTSPAATILVKGSRGARMEGIIELLQQRTASTLVGAPDGPSAPISQPGTTGSLEAPSVPVAL